MTVDAATSPTSLGDRERRRILVTLSVTEITSYGVLYYAFSVLAPTISATENWSATAVTGAFSAGQLTMALAGIPVGHWLDRHGPRGIMTAASILSVPALVTIAAAPNPAWFVVGWVVAGVAMSGVFYPPAFAALTRWYGPSRVAALTVLTLVAGFASTVFAPLTAVLVSELDWRQTYVVLTAILATVTIPAHMWGLRGRWPRAEPHSDDEDSPAAVVRTRPFVALVLALTLTSFAAIAAAINLVPLLAERGIDRGVAAIALGLGGAGQVLGRLGYGPAARRLGVRGRTILVLLSVAITTMVLGLVTAVTAIIVISIVAGMSRGVFTLLHATAVTDRWGATHYGRLTGLLSAPMTIAVAVAPWGGAAIASALGSYSAMFVSLAAVGVAGAALATASTPRPTGSSTEQSTSLGR